MFAKAFYSTIKGIHLALEVKNSFGYSMLVTGHHQHRQKKEKKKPANKKVTKQMLSDYTQQDLSTVIKTSPPDMQWL
jgi:hypothetical protein